jgi:hypothetical protein
MALMAMYELGKRVVRIDLFYRTMGFPMSKLLVT